jgi:hypothetical protein
VDNTKVIFNKARSASSSLSVFILVLIRPWIEYGSYISKEAITIPRRYFQFATQHPFVQWAVNIILILFIIYIYIIYIIYYFN